MWVPITLAAATFQILPTSRQHQLRSILSVNAAGYVRYAYGLPLALFVAVTTYVISRRGLPGIPLRFWSIIAGAGVTQIGGTLAGWATAVTLTNATTVRTLGQVELVMAFAISVFWLHEHHKRSERPGVGRRHRRHRRHRLRLITSPDGRRDIFPSYLQYEQVYWVSA